MIKKHNLRRFPRYSQSSCPFAKGQFSTTVSNCSSTILRKQPPQFYGHNHIRFLYKKCASSFWGIDCCPSVTTLSHFCNFF